MFALLKYERTEISFFLRLVYLLIRGCIQRINFSANIHFPTCFFTLSLVTQLLFHSFNFFDPCVSRKFHDNSSIITLHKFNNTVFSSYKGFSSHVTSWTSTCLMRLRSEEYISHYRADDGRSVSQNVAPLNIFVHDLRNLLCYEH